MDKLFRKNIFVLIAVTLLSALLALSLFSCGDDEEEENPADPGGGDDTTTTTNTASVPANAATSVSFSDTDQGAGEIGGEVTIMAATDESDVDSYVLYYSADGSSKTGNAVTTITANGSASYSYDVHANTAVTSDTNFIVFTKNAAGEMATGVSCVIVDSTVTLPTHKASSVIFTDEDMDPNEIAGTVQITKATDESDVDEYYLYYSEDGSTKSGNAIATFTADGSSAYTFTVSTSTSLGSKTHFITFTSNTNGMMAAGEAVAIVDKSLPAPTVVADFGDISQTNSTDIADAVGEWLGPHGTVVISNDGSATYEGAPYGKVAYNNTSKIGVNQGDLDLWIFDGDYFYSSGNHYVTNGPVGTNVLFFSTFHYSAKTNYTNSVKTVYSNDGTWHAIDFEKGWKQIDMQGTLSNVGTVIETNFGTWSIENGTNITRVDIEEGTDWTNYSTNIYTVLTTSDSKEFLIRTGYYNEGVFTNAGTGAFVKQ